MMVSVYNGSIKPNCTAQYVQLSTALYIQNVEKKKTRQQQTNVLNQKGRSSRE